MRSAGTGIYKFHPAHGYSTTSRMCLVCELIVLISMTGIYVLMFLDIFYTFWKMIVLTSLLVIAFGLSFYMVFDQPGILFSRTPFSDPARSLLKTMTMTTGEFEFDGIFQQTAGGVMRASDIPGPIPFPEITYILWIIFLILMPILLTNLLVWLTTNPR